MELIAPSMLFRDNKIFKLKIIIMISYGGGTPCTQWAAVIAQNSSIITAPQKSSELVL